MNATTGAYEIGMADPAPRGDRYWTPCPADTLDIGTFDGALRAACEFARGYPGEQLYGIGRAVTGHYEAVYLIGPDGVPHEVLG